MHEQEQSQVKRWAEHRSRDTFLEKIGCNAISVLDADFIPLFLLSMFKILMASHTLIAINLAWSRYKKLLQSWLNVENFIDLDTRPWVLNNAVITDLDPVQFFQNIWARLFLKYIMQAKKEVLGRLLTDRRSQCKKY